IDVDMATGDNETLRVRLEKNERRDLSVIESQIEPQEERMKFATSLGILAVAGMLAIGCTTKSEEKPPADSGKIGSTPAMAIANPDPKICPVSGEEIDGKTFVEMDGKKYAFCCEKCVPQFKADPQKFLAKK